MSDIVSTGTAGTYLLDGIRREGDSLRFPDGSTEKHGWIIEIVPRADTRRMAFCAGLKEIRRDGVVARLHGGPLRAALQDAIEFRWRVTTS